jgi:phosphoenolpyruvate-protein phosphotransferase
MIKGIPVSPGVSVARAFCVEGPLARREPITLDTGALAGEVARLDRALAAAGRELDALISRVAAQVGDDEAAIFRAHRQLLRDPTLPAKLHTLIRNRHVDAASAVHQALDEYTALFAHISDEYLRERLADVRDVAARVLTQLAREQPQAGPANGEPVVLVTPEILPSQALAFDRSQVAGLLTETGGPTGHAAILARALGIPAVSGVPGLMDRVRSGDLIALDGRDGHFYVNPGPEVESAYRKLQREYSQRCGELATNQDLPAQSADGEAAELLANVNGPLDAAQAGCGGATGVGLYRTEYLFLSHPSLPDEEEQYRAYRAVIESAPNRRVTVRTLDLGGDKAVPYLGHQREANPFMGFRSIRLSSAHPELLQTQLRAILRAARHGRVELLFPMISTLEEVYYLKKVVVQTQLALQRAGVAHAEGVPLGIMIEVPAAALCINELLDEVDFISIGSNDLIQYLMAADRDNPRVAHLCEPFSPALLRVLRTVIRACNERGKPVTLCGEMAGRPRCVLALFGLGLRCYSMSPALVPLVKELLRHTTRTEAEEAARAVLALHTVEQVREYLTERVRRLWPDVTVFDTRL